MADKHPAERIFRASSIVVAVDPDPYAYTVTLRMLTTGGTPTLRPGDRPNLEWNPNWRDAAARDEEKRRRCGHDWGHRIGDIRYCNVCGARDSDAETGAFEAARTEDGDGA